MKMHRRPSEKLAAPPPPFLAGGDEGTLFGLAKEGQKETLAIFLGGPSKKDTQMGASSWLGIFSTKMATIHLATRSAFGFHNWGHLLGSTHGTGGSSGA